MSNIINFPIKSGAFPILEQPNFLQELFGDDIVAPAPKRNKVGAPIRRASRLDAIQGGMRENNSKSND